MVGVPRLELGTPGSQSQCASQLRHTPTNEARLNGNYAALSMLLLPFFYVRSLNAFAVSLVACS